MSVIRVAVVEDEDEQIEILSNFIERFQDGNGTVIKLRIFQDGEDIIEDYIPEYDIILMDIQMRFMDGMTAARHIRERDQNVVIMFITNMAGYAIQGYDVSALDYILKPLSYDMFAKKLERAIKVIKPVNDHYVMLNVKDSVIKLDISKITYIEAQSHQMLYHTAEDVYSVRGRLDDLESEYIPFGFFRSNRGYLVNLNCITSIKDECCIIGGNMLPISRNKKSELMQRLAEIL